VVGVLVVYAGLYPTALAIVPTHAYREPIPDPPSGYVPVTFESADGLQLSGWYEPSENGAAVVLVHGGGGDRTGPLDHAALLRRHGDGVLVYDSRGRGESEERQTRGDGDGRRMSMARSRSSMRATTSRTAGSAA
jgi:uncharacterized protein